MEMRVRGLRSRQRRITSERAVLRSDGMATRWAGSVMACIFWMNASEEKGVCPYTIWYRIHPRLHTSDGRPTCAIHPGHTSVKMDIVAIAGKGNHGQPSKRDLIHGKGQSYWRQVDFMTGYVNKKESPSWEDRRGCWWRRPKSPLETCSSECPPAPAGKIHTCHLQPMDLT